MKYRFGDFFADRKFWRLFYEDNEFNHKVVPHMKHITIQPLKKVVRITINDGGQELSISIDKEHVIRLVKQFGLYK